MRIAIMQGRLLRPQGGSIQCFPRENWVAEFRLAAEAELDAIEWIFDEPGEKVNPIATDEGIARIRSLSKANGVAVVSLCADYFMERPLLATGTEGHERVSWLLERCRLLGIERMVIPFVDNSRIETPQQQAEAISLLQAVAPFAARKGVELHLETSLEPLQFSELLNRLPYPAVKVNYDVGNSASLGHDFREEFAAYGNRIGSVHVKDRVRGGGTVPLGEGDADMPGVMEALRRIGYAGDFVLQVARGQCGDEMHWTKQNRALVLRHWRQLGPETER